MLTSDSLTNLVMSLVSACSFNSFETTTTLNKGIYVFFFNQKGLMGGLGLQGTKITQYTPSK
jgi:hypothetical protein